MDISSGAHEYLDLLLMDAGLLMVVPIVALMQLLLYSNPAYRCWVDIDDGRSKEFPEEGLPLAGSRTRFTHPTADIELKPVQKVEGHFRRRRPIVIER